MSRLMIVEDELIERTALKLMIQTNCPFISDIIEAENGFRAIEKCREGIPDIIMVDINMPGINGLETIKEIQKISRRPRFLILTSYNQFEYAQTALKLGVEDFILKPAKISDLKKSLENTVEKIHLVNVTEREKTALLTSVEEIRPIVEIDCIYGFVSGKSTEELCRLISFLGFEAVCGFCIVCGYERHPAYILRTVKTALQGVGIDSIGDIFHNNLVLFILSKSPIQERKMMEVGHFVRMLLDEAGKAECRLGVGRIYDLGKNMRESYREALCAAERCNQGEYLVYQETVQERQHKTADFDIPVKGIINALKSGIEDEILANLEEVFKISTVYSFSLKQMKENVYQFMTICFREIKKQYPQMYHEDLFTLSYEDFLGSDDSQSLETFVKMRFQALLEKAAECQKVKSNILVEQAKAYIEENYNRNILLEHVAEALTISPFYLSRILKKHTGENFTDLLAKKRIEAAKELLRQNKSIKEVTFEVGYNSQNYFTKIFKKFENCTPREYRAKVQ